MGEERDRLIRRLGGVPLSAENLSDAELVARRMAFYRREGRLPPEVERLRSKVGYGTLLTRPAWKPR